MASPTWPPKLDAEVDRHLALAPKCHGMKDKGGYARCSCGFTVCTDGEAPMLCAYELLKQVSAVLNGMEQHINLVELIRKTHEGTFRWEQKSRTFTTQCPFCDFDKISLSIRPQAFKCYACGAGGGVTEWMWHLVADRGFRNAWKEAKDGQDASE